MTLGLEYACSGLGGGAQNKTSLDRQPSGRATLWRDACQRAAPRALRAPMGAIAPNKHARNDFVDCSIRNTSIRCDAADDNRLHR